MDEPEVNSIPINLQEKKISINASLYLLSDVIGKGVNFLLIPIYTFMLTQKEYGVWGLSSSLIGLFNTFFTLQLATYVTMNYFSDQHVNRKELISTTWITTVLTSCFFSVMVYYLAIWASGFITTIAVNISYLILAILVSLLYSFLLVPFAVVRIREQAVQFFTLNTGITLLSAVFSLVLVIGFKQGLSGILVGMSVSYALFFPLALYFVRKDIKLRINYNMVKNAIIICTPLVPHMLSHWGLNLSDRMIIGMKLPAEDLGIYQLGYQVGIIFQVSIIAINNAWLPHFLKKVINKNEWVDLRKQSTDIFIIQSIIGVSVLYFGKYFIRFATPENYRYSEVIYTWIVLGFYFLSIYQFYVNNFIAHKQTRLIPIATFIGAVVNIGLNLLFVEKWGVIVAAINTTIGYFTLCILIITFSRKIPGYSYDKRLWGKTIGIFIISFTLLLLTEYTLLRKFDLVLNGLIYILAIFAYILVLRKNRKLHLGLI